MGCRLINTLFKPLLLWMLTPALLFAQGQAKLVYLGDTSVRVIHKQQGKGKTLVHLHSNETTALRAATQYIHQQGGHLITLQHKGTRNIAFHLQGKKYEFDPNRIFTDQGIRNTLSTYGAYSHEAHLQVKRLAKAITAEIPQGKVIAVHNNRSYSMQDYFPRQPLANDAKALYHKPETSLRNFYFVTKRDDFARLRQQQFNVALQAENAQDDGSLSYFLGNSQYINIEAAYNAFAEQVRMLRAA